MNITRTGMVLNTQNYRDCVSFYRDILDLTVLFEKSGANFRPTRLTFSGSQLMIETDGIAVLRGKSDEPSVIKQIDDFA